MEAIEAKHVRTDVDELRTHFLQDYIKLKLFDGWQDELNSVLPKLTNSTDKSRYSKISDKMDEVGPNNYTVDMMDVSAISTLIFYPVTKLFKHIIPDEVKNQLVFIKEDRNNSSPHSGYNEQPIDLLVDLHSNLNNIKTVLSTIYKVDVSVPGKERADFRKKYNSLIKLIKSEITISIDYYSMKSEVDAVIKTIAESSDPSSQFLSTLNILKDSYRITEKDDTKLNYYITTASDAGIPAAHLIAAEISSKDEEKYDRLLMCVTNIERIDSETAQQIVNMINEWRRSQQKSNDKIEKILDIIRSSGANIELTENGYELVSSQESAANLSDSRASKPIGTLISANKETECATIEKETHPDEESEKIKILEKELDKIKEKMKKVMLKQVSNIQLPQYIPSFIPNIPGYFSFLTIPSPFEEAKKLGEYKELLSKHNEIETKITTLKGKISARKVLNEKGSIVISNNP